MTYFYKLFKAFYKQFLIFQGYNLFILIMLRTLTTVNWFVFIGGISVLVVTLITLVSYESFRVLPISFQNMFKALMLGYVFYNILYIIVLFTYPLNDIFPYTIWPIIFLAISLISYIAYFNSFRSKGNSLQESNTPFRVEETSNSQYIKVIFRLIATVLSIALLKNAFNNQSVSTEWSYIWWIVLIVSVMLYMPPIKKAYGKLVGHDY